MKNKREQIIEYLEYYSDEFIDLIFDLMNSSDWVNKNDLIKLSGAKLKTYDTATPYQYMDKIREIYPNLDKGNYIFDYTVNKFGELVNINDLLSARIIEIIRNKRK